MKILHTESSNGWGGQEIRILREAQGMRMRGHQIVIAVTKGGKLAARARSEGFEVYEIDFSRRRLLLCVFELWQIIRKCDIDLVNTHSSLDAWIGGLTARLSGRKLVRTRHLTTPIRTGLNSRLLYKTLADFVVTTSSSIIPTIVAQAKISKERCSCIATGIDPLAVQADPAEVQAFRNTLGLKEGELLIGTACMVRSWKGIQDLIHAADRLRQFRFVIIGGGYLDPPRKLIAELHLEKVVHLIGHLERPYAAIAALDIFTLLSTGHEGISQALLQAAYLQRPLIATRIGGSPEICIDNQTGKLVSPNKPDEVVQAVLQLASDVKLRERMGAQGKQLVENNFTLTHTLDEMEGIYRRLS